MTLAAQRINRLASACNAAVYLEIGLREGYTFNAVQVETKHGVDPDLGRWQSASVPDHLHACTSDEFFASKAGQELMVDIAYVDGLHHADQALRDVINCFNAGADVVLLDDVWPCDRFSALPDYELALFLRAEHGNPYRVQESAWHGDVYRAAMTLAQCPELCVNTIIGYGNAQSVITRSTGRGQWNELSISKLRSVPADYDQFLEAGVQMLNCSSESAVLSAACARLSAGKVSSRG